MFSKARFVTWHCRECGNKARSRKTERMVCPVCGKFWEGEKKEPLQEEEEREEQERESGHGREQVADAKEPEVFPGVEEAEIVELPLAAPIKEEPFSLGEGEDGASPRNKQQPQEDGSGYSEPSTGLKAKKNLILALGMALILVLGAGYYYVDKQRQEEARQAELAAMKQELTIKIIYAEELLRFKKYQDAVDVYSGGINAGLPAAELRCKRGQAYEKWGKFEKAQADYTEALKADPSNAEAQKCLKALKEKMDKQKAKAKKVEKKNKVKAVEAKKGESKSALKKEASESKTATDAKKEAQTIGEKI